MRITRITKIHNGLYAHICPACGNILASSYEPDLMPEFSICPCDRNYNKIPAYDLYPDNGYIMIRRNKFPKFIGIASTGEIPSVDNIQWQDECEEKDRDKAVKKAIEFIRKYKYNKSCRK